MTNVPGFEKEYDLSINVDILNMLRSILGHNGVAFSFSFILFSHIVYQNIKIQNQNIE